VAGPTIGTWLYDSGALSLNLIFWLIAGLLGVGACMMLLFAKRAFPRSSARGTGF
jgi:hypothetical protein